MIGRVHVADAWMWSAWQPDRGMCFNSYLFERAGGLVAVDPLPLDDDSLAQIERMGGVRAIVLTNRDHRRAAKALRERFGSAVLAHQPEAKVFDIAIDETFEDGAEVFPGAFAIALPGGKTPGEVALHFPGTRAALIGDAVIGTPAGNLSFLPDEKLESREALALALRRLWGLQLEALLLCDGQPILSGADDVLGKLLETCGGPEVNRINLRELAYKHGRRAGYNVDYAEVGLLIGARKLGYQVAKLQPGNAYCPLHWHRIAEEFFYVLEGAPSIRTGRGTIQLCEGDFMAFPTGDRGAHQLRNDSDRDCLVLLVGYEDEEEEVCYYPDSDKIGVYGRDYEHMVRASPKLDYWDGE